MRYVQVYNNQTNMLQTIPQITIISQILLKQSNKFVNLYVETYNLL